MTQNSTFSTAAQNAQFTFLFFSLSSFVFNSSRLAEFESSICFFMLARYSTSRLEGKAMMLFNALLIVETCNSQSAKKNSEAKIFPIFSFFSSFSEFFKIFNRAKTPPSTIIFSLIQLCSLDFPGI